jgi:hypothetical protein
VHVRERVRGPLEYFSSIELSIGQGLRWFKVGWALSLRVQCKTEFDRALMPLFSDADLQVEIRAKIARPAGFHGAPAILRISGHPDAEFRMADRRNRPKTEDTIRVRREEAENLSTMPDWPNINVELKGRIHASADILIQGAPQTAW